MLLKNIDVSENLKHFELFFRIRFYADICAAFQADKIDEEWFCIYNVIRIQKQNQ